jgi:long-subunit fatty acid transport protein
MTQALTRRALRALLALPLLVAPVSAQASGFAIESQGARAMGFAGAYVAQASDPSAIFYNAAGIAFLKGKQLYVSGALAGLSTDFTGAGPNPPAGTLESTSNGLSILPSFYYSQQVKDSVVVGIGVTKPFATKASWTNPDEFTGRFICVECSLSSWSINPTVAFRLADRFSIGGGLDVRFSKFDLSRRLIADPNPFPVPTDVAQLTLASDTKTALGFNAGILAMPSENFSVGLSYRHKVTVDHAAQADLRPDPHRQHGARPGGRDRAARLAAGDGQLHLPGQLRGGSGAAPRLLDDRGRLPVDAVVEVRPGRDRLHERPTFSTTLPLDWKDTWRGAIGAEYLIKDDWEAPLRLRLRPQPGADRHDLALHPRRGPPHLRTGRQLEVREAKDRLRPPLRPVAQQLDPRHQPLRLRRRLQLPLAAVRRGDRVQVLASPRSFSRSRHASRDSLLHCWAAPRFDDYGPVSDA